MKATHSGHCQACGSLQKLPNDRLSKHGYTVTHGYFSGVCRGAGHEPFEVSCDLVKRFVEEARAQLISVEDFQTKLRKPVTEPSAFFRTSKAHPKGHHYGRTRGDWTRLPVTETVVPFLDGDGSYSKFTREGDTAWKSFTAQREGYKPYVDHRIEPVTSEVSHAYGQTLLEVCTAANRVYADWLEHEIDSLSRYIEWQTERVKAWKPAPLLPVDAKNDKLGFKPTEPRY